MTALAWLDKDGTHVWFAHDCLAGRETALLPWPKWHRGTSTDEYLTGPTMVVPSVSCEACGFHSFMSLSADTTEADDAH